jgi:hypothetical protein
MKKFFAVVAMMAMVSSATAATLSDVSGSVLVNKGKGFVPAAGVVKLKVGDKVLVGEGGFASVAYGKCSVSLDKPTVHAVKKVAPCNEMVISPVADLDPPVAGGAAGGAGAAGGGLLGGAGALAGLPAAALVAGGVATIAGGALLARRLSKDKNCVSC